MKNKLLQILIFVIFLSLMFKSNLVVTEIKEALQIFFNILFPSIFPFFIITDLLINYNFCQTLNRIFSKVTNFLFHTSNASNFVIIMSLLSGFPSGTKFIKSLYDKKLLTTKQANYLITFTHFSNPLFIIITVSTIFKNTKVVYLILLTHILANIIIGIIIRPKEKEEIKNITVNKPQPFSTALTNSITSSINLLLIILGNTCFFFIISEIITKTLNLSIIGTILINGLLDITKGINFISTIYINDVFKGILILTFLSFGGINIHMQVLSIIENSKIEYKNFLLGRISQAAISSVLFYLLYNLLP